MMIWPHFLRKQAIPHRHEQHIDELERIMDEQAKTRARLIEQIRALVTPHNDPAD